MHFGTKNYLKSTHNHTTNHALNPVISRSTFEADKYPKSNWSAWFYDTNQLPIITTVHILQK